MRKLQKICERIAWNVMLLAVIAYPFLAVNYSMI